MAAAETTAVEAAETKTSQDEEEEYAYDPTTGRMNSSEPLDRKFLRSNTPLPKREVRNGELLHRTYGFTRTGSIPRKQILNTSAGTMTHMMTCVDFLLSCFLFGRFTHIYTKEENDGNSYNQLLKLDKNKVGDYITTPAVTYENLTKTLQLHRRSVLVDRLCFSVYGKW